MPGVAAFQFDDNIPVEGAWLLSPMEQLIPTDDIERNGVAPEARKALADLLRYLVQLPLQRPDQE